MAAASSELSPIEDLPTDILSQILLRLPNIKSLLLTKLVCKSWFTLISSSEFTHLYNLRHNNNSLLVCTKLDLNCCRPCSRYLYGAQFNGDDVSKAEKIELLPYLNKLVLSKIVASCHDLLLCIFGNSTLILLNPLTRLYHVIPRLLYCNSDDSIIDPPFYYEINGFGMFGIGYDHVRDDYKVMIFENDTVVNQVFLYSLRDRSWERKRYFTECILNNRAFKQKIINIIPDFSTDITRPAVVANCLLHFIYGRKLIVRFDVCNGRWSEIPAPDVESYLNDIGVLNGWLSLLEGGNKLWVMKEYAVKESWVLLLSVSDLYPIRALLASTPLAISNDKNEILLFLKHQWRISYVWYNLKEKKTRKAQISPSGEYVSLKSKFPITDISKFNKTNQGLELVTKSRK